MSDNTTGASITLHFASNDEKNQFMGELSDGIGEGICTFTWPGKEDGAPFYEAKEFTVELLEDDDDDLLLFDDDDFDAFEDDGEDY